MCALVSMVRLTAVVWSMFVYMCRCNLCQMGKNYLSECHWNPAGLFWKSWRDILEYSRRRSGETLSARPTRVPSQYCQHWWCYTSFTTCPRAEYEYSAGPNSNTLHHSVPCAVCYASARSSILMIPAKIQCPSTWTREYYGYLSSERANEPSQVPSGHYRSSFNCVDVNPEVIENSSGNRDGALFYYVLSDCDTNGLNCPPYEDGRILSCAVCTK